MQAIILAAGLGTRLKPLTDDRPKALVLLKGMTLLDRAIAYLTVQGIERIVVNIHHFGNQIADHISHGQYDVPVLISDERRLLKDTGGALVQALPLLSPDEDILIYNTDIVTDMLLSKLFSAHIASGNDATLLTSVRESTRQLAFSPKGWLTGWQNKKNDEIKGVLEPDSRMFSFSGIHIIKPSLIGYFGQEFGDAPFSVIPAYILAALDHKIGYYMTPESIKWMDVGSPEKLKLAEEYLLKEE
ncbi:MAG TPA: sugar phosphate nucleotidyltransferase [Saprospiraceae bacterium]|jgi:NDP-sugar pyrophosphorylase family protein|nr:MAG: nucleotidyl transferase [Candidatus Parvibacillus calidus]MBX2937535.1 NTP transferase domain-containing protein [Saprospiraceae bacterium]MBK7741923.1 NTP transferase domain-containing protein [Candidatus Parvibacillus calidus]MBX7177974.1 NTP transferase domain-containing protein [Saprospiraceae bacterium]MCB0589705.1 NTP transferase domain-containing protein [Saprospiraceae bacterium]